MGEFAGTGVFANEYDSSVVRHYISNVFEHIVRKDGVHPDGTEVFSDCSSSELALHVALASYVTVNAIRLCADETAQIGPEQIASWQANNPDLTLDQVKIYGRIAAGFCTAAGMPEQGEAVAYYIDCTAESVLNREEGCSNIHYLLPEQIEPDFEPLARSAA
jgi:hypothetical protein